MVQVSFTLIESFRSNMGATPSKEELLYHEVQNGNHDAVKSFRRDGASLEWVDKEGRTPLLLACSRGELLDMTITLLNLGANMKAYCSGTHGGYPLHHAAKRGLDKTVTLLLSHGANPLAINDEGQTPLEMARSRGHVAVVRLLEEKLCIFSGTLRELSGTGLLESLAPSLVTKKVWAVVLPRKSHSRRAPDYELATYEPPKLSLWNGVRASSAHPAGLCNVAQPRTVITLAKAEMEEPDFTLPDSVLCITDKVHKTKYKFFAENKADKEQLKNLYKACKEVSQGPTGRTPELSEDNARGSEQLNILKARPINARPSQSRLSACTQPVLQSVSAPSSGRFNPVTSNKSMADPMSEELAFALALNESIRTATAEGISVSPDTSIAFCPNKHEEWNSLDSICNGWSQNLNKQYKTKTAAYKAMSSASQRWSSASVVSSSFKEVPSAAAAAPPPSAPPFSDKATHRSSFETGTRSGGMCVVCWDAPAEGACIPCGHLAGCMNCLTKVQSKRWGCPVCRGLIDQVIKVYAV